MVDIGRTVDTTIVPVHGASLPRAAQMPRILVIRRDNIGDLVCTTPLLTGLRRQFPQAWIGVFANSYNAPIIERNADIDALFAYRKAKHVGIIALGVAIERVRLIMTLRRADLDYALLATTSFQPRSIRLARAFGARQVVVFADASQTAPRLDQSIVPAGAALTEVEEVYRIGAPLGLGGAPPPLALTPDPVEVNRALGAVSAWRTAGLVIGIHISARKPSQRWPINRFAAVMRALAATYGVSFMLFWSPGSETSPTHPGDDEKAAALQGLAVERRMRPWPTHTLAQLVGGIAACDTMVMSDGGAMHIAAALGKPIVGLFGGSDATRWRPWGVPHRIVQPASRDVGDVSVAEVVAAFDALAAETRLSMTALAR